MSRPQETDDKFNRAILLLEESIFEYEDIMENDASKLSEEQKEDLIKSIELACSARDLTVSVIASIKGKTRRKKVPKR